MSAELLWMRERLDRRLAQLKQMGDLQRPHKGWLAAIREVLGMTVTQFGEQMGISQAAAFKMEKREQEKTIQLQTLEKAATALNCELVYALVPKTTLQGHIEHQAKIKAMRYLQAVGHSMSLEQQAIDDDATKAQFQQLVAEFQANPKTLWSA